MSSVILNGDTSGSVTLTVPSVAGTNTVTVPSATGTVMVSGNMPAFSAYQSSAQTLSSATLTKIQFQTEEWDTNNNFDNATNYRFTPTVAGYYQVNTGIVVSSSVTSINLVIYKNGSLNRNLFQTNTSAGAGTGSVCIYMNGSTDYIEVYCFLSTGQALAAGSQYTYFQASMVRAA